jgi:hypothetical protein
MDKFDKLMAALDSAIVEARNKIDELCLLNS